MFVLIKMIKDVRMLSVHKACLRTIPCISMIMISFFPHILSAFTIDSLSDSQLETLDSLSAHYLIDYCCNSTISECFNQKHECPIAKHLYEFTGWLISVATEPGKIKEQIDKRYEGFTTTEKKVIDTTSLQLAGNPKAPVTIVAYISSTCNLCKHIVCLLYVSVNTGTLKGRAKLMAKPFGTGIGDIAFFVANDDGKFWELLMKMKDVKTRYKENDIIQMLENIGIDSNRSIKLLKNRKFKELLTASRTEGVKNGVKVTPTFFINHKRYSSYKDPQWVIDAALYEYEKTLKD